MLNFKKLYFVLQGFVLPAYMWAQNIVTYETDDIKPKTPLKLFKDVISKTEKDKTNNGLIRVYKEEDSYFFEVPDLLLGRDLLVVNRISKAATNGRVQMLGFAGDLINENVIQFARGPNNKLFLKNISYTEISNDSTSNGMYRSVLNNNLQPVAAAFDIKALAKDSAGVLIDVTDYLNGDNNILFFDATIKTGLGLGDLQADRSYINTVRAYPMNIEIKTFKTYIKPLQPASPLGPAQPGGFASYELNSSIVLLPEKPMRPRSFDARVGYFATGYTDFDANPHGIEKASMITRWKLEPSEEDKSKYLRGELVEPKNPIIYYIDPSTPKNWVPFLIQGIEDWQKAFEQAGFKNAIVAKEAPIDDSTWSLEDARHNVLVYKPSAISNASGSYIHDPRSGEIIETHIDWYHNIMQVLHNWYMIQAAAVDPKARTMKFSEELMGQLIRLVVSHEVGHTLGLRHNYGSSSTVAVENLRNKAWVEANGDAPSIMDYARFNYVAQPEDNIGEAGLLPRIGVYDDWAIEWGYRWWPELSKEKEKAKLNAWIIEKLKDKRLWFGTEDDANDPRSQNEDLGDDAMKAGMYGIKNLQRIVADLPEWTKEANEGYSGLREMYEEVTQQYARYINHVIKNIGGIMTTPKTVEEKGNVFEYVSKEKQQSAIQFLQTQLFNTPTWLLDRKIFNLTGTTDGAFVSTLQSDILGKLISSETMEKLSKFEAYDVANAYSPTMMVSELKKGIWSELTAHKEIDMYRRNLQKAYVEKLISILNLSPTTQLPPGLILVGGSGNSNTSDALSIIKGHSKILMAEIKAALPFEKDEMTRLHLQDCLDRLRQALPSK